METQITSSGASFDFNFPKSKFLFVFAGFVGLYGIVYLALLINVLSRTGSHIF